MKIEFSEGVTAIDIISSMEMIQSACQDIYEEIGKVEVYSNSIWRDKANVLKIDIQKKLKVINQQAECTKNTIEVD